MLIIAIIIDVYLLLGSVCYLDVPLFLSRKLLVPLERRLIEMTISSLPRLFCLFHLMIRFNWFRTVTAFHLFRKTARLNLFHHVHVTRVVRLHPTTWFCWFHWATIIRDMTRPGSVGSVRRPGSTCQPGSVGPMRCAVAGDPCCLRSCRPAPSSGWPWAVGWWRSGGSGLVEGIAGIVSRDLDPLHGPRCLHVKATAVDCWCRSVSVVPLTRIHEQLLLLLTHGASPHLLRQRHHVKASVDMFNLQATKLFIVTVTTPLDFVLSSRYCIV